MAVCAILQKVCCSMPNHEALQLLIQDSAVPHTIHHLALIQPLQGVPAPPAEAASGHDLGGVLDSFPGESGVKPVRAWLSPAQMPGVGKPQLKMTFITEHYFFPVVHRPVSVALTEGEPLVPHGLGEERLGSHLPGGQVEVLSTKHLDAPDGEGLQGRHQGLQLLGRQSGVPVQVPLHGLKGDFHHF